MIKFYHSEPSGNSEIIVSTTAITVDDFVQALSKAMAEYALEHFQKSNGIDYINNYAGQLEYEFDSIIQNSAKIMFKLAGYKSEGLHEFRVLTSGSVFPEDSKQVYPITQRAPVVIKVEDKESAEDEQEKIENKLF